MDMTQKVEIGDLLVNIKSTRNVNEIKHKLESEQRADEKQKRRAESKKEKAKKELAKRRQKRSKLPFYEDEEEAAELEAIAEEKKRNRSRKKVLDAPLHRQAQQRIEGKLAYRQTKNELRQWQPIVDGMRVAEQLQFPHDERLDNPLKVQTAEERALAFTPRTEFELKIAELLNKSKSNIRSDEEFSQAEKEILKAMDVKEAKRKCEEMRKMRALMSFHSAKLKRQSKIKSKQFHRIRKRQQRRELIKDVETLIVRNPEEAAKKLKELEKDRAFERASLKHRGTNKWTKQVRKFASRNHELKKVLDEHLRLGKELKGRHGAEQSGDDESDESEENNSGDEQQQHHQTLVQQRSVQTVQNELATRSAAAGTILHSSSSFSKDVVPLQIDEKNPFFRSALQNIRREQKSREKGEGRRSSSPAKKTEKRSKESKKSEYETKVVTEGKGEDDNDDDSSNPQRKQADMGKKRAEEEFLNLNIRKLVQIPEELLYESEDVQSTGLQHAFMSEAYQNDDLLEREEFEARKTRVEEEEKKKQLPSRYELMRGWGSWTGPGISEEREKQRMDRILGREPVPKIKERRRKDAQRRGLIIRESVSESIQKLQPKDVPFPFTRIQDYEAFVQQPLGREWTTPIAHQQLNMPAVVTKAGKIIRPLDRTMKMRRREFGEAIDGAN